MNKTEKIILVNTNSINIQKIFGANIGKQEPLVAFGGKVNQKINISFLNLHRDEQRCFTAYFETSHEMALFVIFLEHTMANVEGWTKTVTVQTVGLKTEQ